MPKRPNVSSMCLAALCVTVLSGCCITIEMPHSTPQDLYALEGAPSSPLHDVAWIGGSWATDPAEETVYEEHWMPPVGDLMVGMARTSWPTGIGNPFGFAFTTTPDGADPGQVLGFEYLRIEARDDGIVYVASPNGRHPPTEFRLTEAEPLKLAVFENPEHDYPKKLVYRIEEPHLVIEIHGEDPEHMQRLELFWSKITNAVHYGLQQEQIRCEDNNAAPDAGDGDEES